MMEESSSHEEVSNAKLNLGVASWTFLISASAVAAVPCLFGLMVAPAGR